MHYSIALLTITRRLLLPVTLLYVMAHIAQALDVKQSGAFFILICVIYFISILVSTAIINYRSSVFSSGKFTRNLLLSSLFLSILYSLSYMMSVYPIDESSIFIIKMQSFMISMIIIYIPVIISVCISEIIFRYIKIPNKNFN